MRLTDHALDGLDLPKEASSVLNDLHLVGAFAPAVGFKVIPASEVVGVPKFLQEVLPELGVSGAYKVNYLEQSQPRSYERDKRERGAGFPTELDLVLFLVESGQALHHGLKDYARVVASHLFQVVDGELYSLSDGSTSVMSHK